VSVTAKRGAALLFWHGQHPGSPVHEGEMLRGGRGVKHIIRTDVLYLMRPRVLVHEVGELRGLTTVKSLYETCTTVTHEPTKLFTEKLALVALRVDVQRAEGVLKALRAAALAGMNAAYAQALASQPDFAEAYAAAALEPRGAAFAALDARLQPLGAFS